MLIFRKIKYKNFLSTGNAWNEYQLNGHQHTLIVGANGSGKSTLLDALCFGLYGKPFRNANKPTIINAINQKNLLVEIEFSTQNNDYVIRRGIKPTIFEIICNGQKLPELPSALEMQEFCERYILKCNYKAFTQVVILGASSYVPFMRLTPASRREILEDVLDIEVFSIMHSLVKSRLSRTKDALQKAQGVVSVVESQHALVKTYTEQWTQQQDEKRQRLETQLAQTESQLAALTAERLTPVSDEAKWQALVDKMPEWQEKHTKANKLVAKFATEQQHLTHSHQFFADHDQCPMCQQTIDDTFKQDKLGATEAALAKATTDYAEAEKIAATIAKKLDACRNAQRALQDVALHRKQQDEQIKSLAKDRQRLQDEIQRTFEPPPSPPTELGDLDAAQADVSRLAYEKQIQEQSNVLLKDSGIRTRIIQQYLPVINKWVNTYLQALNFPIQFTLNEEFEETIKSRHRDEFSYENFSEGEKRRIDLALVLTWRAVARMKNSVYTNLIIFDEVFDSSLDVSGTDDFLSLLQTMGADTNSFVISHRTDAMIDKFSSVMMVTKEKNFSRVKPL